MLKFLFDLIVGDVRSWFNLTVKERQGFMQLGLTVGIVVLTMCGIALMVYDWRFFASFGAHSELAMKMAGYLYTLGLVLILSVASIAIGGIVAMSFGLFNITRREENEDDVVDEQSRRNNRRGAGGGAGGDGGGSVPSDKKSER